MDTVSEQRVDWTSSRSSSNIKYGAWISGFVINLRRGFCETFQASSACCTGSTFQNFFSFFKALIPEL
jgi:hypothetical protein